MGPQHITQHGVHHYRHFLLAPAPRQLFLCISYLGLYLIIVILAIFGYAGFSDVSDLGILSSYYICEPLYCTCLE